MYSSVWHVLLTLCIWFTSHNLVSILTPMPPRWDILSKHRTLIRSWPEILSWAQNWLLLLQWFYPPACIGLAKKFIWGFPIQANVWKTWTKFFGQSYSNSNGILKTTSYLLPHAVTLLLRLLHLLMAWLTSVELLHTLLRL